MGVDVGAASNGDGRAWARVGPRVQRSECILHMFVGWSQGDLCRASCEWRLGQGVEIERCWSMVNEEAQLWKDQVKVGDMKSQVQPCSNFRSPRSPKGLW